MAVTDLMTCRERFTDYQGQEFKGHEGPDDPDPGVQTDKDNTLLTIVCECARACKYMIVDFS